jgi:hypothetical protein
MRRIMNYELRIMKVFLICLLSSFIVHNSSFAATSITTRAGVGRSLTWSEMDTNFSNLRDALDSYAGTVAAQITALQQGQSGGTFGYTTKALMDSDLAHPANTLARVTNDGTAANNGIYIKLGASGSGSWQRSTYQDQPFILASWYGNNLNTAIVAIGSTPATLVYSSDLSMSADLTIPATVDLLPINGAIINRGGYTLTGLKTVRPDWFGHNTTPGTTDMSAALQSALSCGARVIDMSGGTYYVPNSTILTFPSDIELIGGTIIGPAGGLGYLKIWGSVDTGVAYGSPISKGVSAFTIANTFAANDILLLSNYPTDATDAYSEGGADIFGRKTRSYTTLSTANKRQTRRKELIVCKTATGSAISTYSGTMNAYTDTTTLQFQKVTPCSRVRFTKVTFQNIDIDAIYAKGLVFDRCRGFRTHVEIQTSLDTTIDFSEFDSMASLYRVDCHEACRNLTITGIYRGTTTGSDNGVVKINGCADFNVNVVVEGVYGISGEGVQVDTNFTENPTGYSDLPAQNFRLDVTARYMNGGNAVQISSDAYAAPASYGSVNIIAEDAGLQIQGANNIVLNGAINYTDGSGNSLGIYGSTGINTQNLLLKGNIYETVYVNPRNGSQSITNSNITKKAGPQTHSAQPGLIAYLTSTQTNVTGDATEVLIPFNSELVDKSSNHLNGVFTVPLTGLYSLSAMIKLTGIASGHTDGWIRIAVGSTSYYYQPQFASLADGAGSLGINYSTMVYATAGDAISIYLRVNGGAKTVDIYGSSSLETFWGVTLLN